MNKNEITEARRIAADLEARLKEGNRHQILRTETGNEVAKLLPYLRHLEALTPPAAPGGAGAAGEAAAALDEAAEYASQSNYQAAYLKARNGLRAVQRAATSAAPAAALVAGEAYSLPPIDPSTDATPAAKEAAKQYLISQSVYPYEQEADELYYLDYDVHRAVALLLTAPAAAPDAAPDAVPDAGGAWCARCPATEADVNSLGFTCGLCAAEGM